MIAEWRVEGDFQRHKGAIQARKWRPPGSRGRCALNTSRVRFKPSLPASGSRRCPHFDTPKVRFKSFRTSRAECGRCSFNASGYDSDAPHKVQLVAVRLVSTPSRYDSKDPLPRCTAYPSRSFNTVWDDSDDVVDEVQVDIDFQKHKGAT